MGSSFGDPTFGAPRTDMPAQPGVESPVNGGTPASALPPESPQELIDPNDPRLTSEELNVNPEADAYAQPAPPPDAQYRAKLKHMRPKNGQQQEVDYLPAQWGQKQPQLVFVTGLEASISDPSGKYDGLKAFDFNVSTFVGRENATKVSSILSKLKQPSGQPWTTKATRGNAKFWMDLLVKALAGEPEVGIETQWEWSCPDCGKEAKAKGTAYPRALVGMHHFPPEQDPAKRKAGQLYSPEVKCGVNPNHGFSRCRITIAKFLSLEELRK
jgi:hypothetical protein